MGEVNQFTFTTVSNHLYEQTVDLLNRLPVNQVKLMDFILIKGRQYFDILLENICNEYSTYNYILDVSMVFGASNQ